MNDQLLELTPIPYHADGAALAARWAHLPGMVFLDGKHTAAGDGWDVIAALPTQKLSVVDYDYDVAAWLDAAENLLVTGGFPAVPKGFPFATGVLGFLDYESAAMILGMTRAPRTAATLGVYRACVLQDHARCKAYFVHDRCCAPEVRQTLMSSLQEVSSAERAEPPDLRLDVPFAADIEWSQYASAFSAIQRYLSAGDCYQVNFAQRFTARFSGNPWHAYRRLRGALSGGFAAYVALQPQHAILSLSPEQFLCVNGEQVVTRPIKGTAPRSLDAACDAERASALLGSAKDRAENVMITDLLRNDLGRWCIPGSVQTPEVCALHSYNNVHHLVSTVTGHLRPEVTAGRLLAACSPGGSITGAPKRRAMEVIAELETAARGVYCGSVFSLARGRVLRSSIAIRTLELSGEELVCWGGGGITVASNPEAEYQETLDKVAVLLNALPGPTGD